MSPVLTLFKLVFSVIGVISIILLSPILLISAIIYFVRAIFTAHRCEMCDKWFAGSSSLCDKCEVIAAMEEYQIQKMADGPWHSVRDDNISHGMDIALAIDDEGILHIGQGREDPMLIEWRILGRDM